MQKFKFLSKDKDGKHSNNNSNNNNNTHGNSTNNKKKRNKHNDTTNAEDSLSLLSEQRRLVSRNAIVSSSGKVSYENNCFFLKISCGKRNLMMCFCKKLCIENFVEKQNKKTTNIADEKTEKI